MWYASILVLLSVVIVVLVGSFFAWGSGARAQEPFATPGPGEFEAAPGVIGRELANGLTEAPPTDLVAFGVLRITSAPGAVFSGGEDDPSIGLLLMESGELSVRIETAVTVTRATGPEEVAAGTEFTLGPGESFVWPANVHGEARNDGAEPTVNLVIYLAPTEGEEATPMAGTPAP